MTSKQVMLILALMLAGCESTREPRGVDALISPYSEGRVWAVAPLRNESGSLAADGLIMADRLQRQLENASNIDVIPVNRVLRAMELLEMAAVESPADAARLMQTLGVDGLIIGTITAYDPYDPPKLGLAIELFDGGRSRALDAFDVRRLSRAATSDEAHPYANGGTETSRVLANEGGVASGVSAFFDAASSEVRRQLQVYGGNRGGPDWHPDGWHRYRISMDLYSEFVTYVMSWRLLRAEARRLDQWVTTSPPQAKAHK
jgi:hypothetical protein